MQRIDGGYLYRLGSQIHPLTELKGPNAQPPSSNFEAFLAIWNAMEPLRLFLTQSLFQPKYCSSAGFELLSNLEAYQKTVLADSDNFNSPIDAGMHFKLTNGASTFETLLASEFSQMSLYFVSKKGGYDTSDLIENGYLIFPKTLAAKVPQSVTDIMQAARCVAFELPTAAGFHILRANESVLRRYYDIVTGGATHPEMRNMGAYLAKLNEMKKGNPKVRAALKDIKDLYRNPLNHPDDSITDVEEAIDLICAVRACVGNMLKEIPDAEVQGVQPPIPIDWAAALAAPVQEPE